MTVEQQQQWLVARAGGAGFQITKTDTGELDLLVHRRETLTFPRKQGRVTLRVATYDGRLEVADAALLRRTLTRGLGHGKAYGCGLLTLAPAEQP